MIYFGYTTSTHGLKGYLKLFTDFSLKEDVLKEGFPIYINNELHYLTSIKKNNQQDLIRIDNLNNINLVEHLRNKKIYVDEHDLEGKFIIETLINKQIENLGYVTEILKNTQGYLLRINKKIIIPFNDRFVKIKENNLYLTEEGKKLVNAL